MAKTFLVRQCHECNRDRDFTDYPREVICFECRVKIAKRKPGKPLTTIQRFNNRLRMYNLTISDYERTLKSQGGKCAICKSHGDLVFDHDYASGKFRGLLCAKCNTGLGMFNDNEDFLFAAIQYIRPSKGI